MRFFPAPKSTSTITASAFFNSGVRVLRTSATGAAAETIKDTGDATVFPSQVVRIESESFPTGIEIPSATQKSDAAFTASKSFASSPGWPQAAIQLAERRTFLIVPQFAAARFVTASVIARRAEAGPLSSATGVRSPVAMAWP